MIDFANNYCALEGVDGAGKSTVIGNLKPLLSPAIEFFHDPDQNTKLGEMVSNIVDNNCDQRASALLYAASSISRQKSMNFHTSNTQYFSDRSALSTFAYSFYFGFDYLINIHNGYLYPKHIFYLSIDPDIAIMRLKKKNENSTTNKISSLINNYNLVLDFFSSEGMLIHIVDASSQSSHIAEIIASQISSGFK